MRLGRLFILLIVIAAGFCYFILDINQYLQVSFLQALFDASPLLSAGIFFLIYVVIAACSIPAAALLTMAAGVVFGLWTGVLLVSFASTLGATLAFLFSRTLLRDWVQTRFGNYLRAFNRGIEKDGGFYLFTLRLIPVVPFAVVNLAMGLTPLRTATFYWVSQLGMLPGTLVYVNAGAELGMVEEFTVEGILTRGLVLSFVLLGIFPFIARGLVAVLKHRRVYRGFSPPKRFDVNLVVIGAGSAGLVSAYLAAATQAKVVLVEKDKMGGDCLNTGCIPSKALIRAARAVNEIRQAKALGIMTAEPQVDFAGVMARIRQVIATIEPHDSVERYQSLGVDCRQSAARIKSPWQIEIAGEVINTRSILIASGASPVIPPIPGLDNLNYLCSDNLWELQELPERLLVMGAGPVGCELAQAFQRLGSQVTLVDRLPRILPKEDKDVSSFMENIFKEEGIRVLTEHQISEFQIRGAENIALLEHQGQRREIAFDRLLIAVGRKANVTGLGLEELGIDIANGLEVDEFMRTSIPNIFACGDVVGPYQFTHAASYQSWYACMNALLGNIGKFKVDYSVIPWATFTDPEVAHVGLSEEGARNTGIAYEITTYNLADLDRAIADNSAKGFIKVLTAPGKDKILGATLVCSQAGELATEFIIALKHGIGLNKILGTIHIYPTLSEANKFVAGKWRRVHSSEKLLALAKRYHRWKLRGWF